jgi:ABC-type dipeptide/oligopeptide/nickel transport system ATPase component
MAPIALDHVEKVYSGGVKALDDLKLEVKEGEFMVLVGPSGCGLTDHCARGLSRIQPPGQDERGQQRVSHPAAAAPDPRYEDLPSHACQRTCREYPDQNTIGREQDGHCGRGTFTARPSIAYTSTASGHGHTMDMANHRLRSLLATGAKPERRGISYIG